MPGGCVIQTNARRSSHDPTWTVSNAARVAVASMLVVLPVSAAAGMLSIADRLNSRRAIEQVYWEHRIWPSENPGPKPPWSAVQSEGSIRDRVEEVLARTRALRERWSEPIDASRLQAEIGRIVRETRDPDRLRELFAAVGNDPERIAEVIARPLLVDRLIRKRFVEDEHIHASTRERARSGWQRAIAGVPFRDLGASVRQVSWVRRGQSPSDDADIEMGDEEWAIATDRLKALFGGSTSLAGISPLEDTDGCVRFMRVLRLLPDSIELEVASWPKLEFDDWWAAHKTEYEAQDPDPLDGPVVIPAIPTSACTDDSWSSMPYVPGPRRTASSVWTGSELIVWGGLNQGSLDTGGIYDPATGSWRPTGYAGAHPGTRLGHSAVWTGAELIIWGGSDGGVELDTGARFNPVTSLWTATSLSTAHPTPRSGHSAVWTGSEMIIWGGYSNTEDWINSGARYSPATDSWIAMTTGSGTPSGRSSHSAVWTGTRMIVWGGRAPDTNTGGIYDPVADLWQATSVGANVPSARYGHTAVWSGNRMIVWGGYPAGVLTNSGGRLDPVSNTWQPTSLGASVPSSRQNHTAVIVGSKMIVWGGSGTTGPVSTGGVYDIAADTMDRDEHQHWCADAATVTCRRHYRNRDDRLGRGRPVCEAGRRFPLRPCPEFVESASVGGVPANAAGSTHGDLDRSRDDHLGRVRN